MINNKMSIKTKNIFFYSAIGIISLLFILLIVYISRYCCFYGDDAWFSLYADNEKIFDCLTSDSHGGKYIGQFLDKFFSYGLPCILGIHPENFINSYHAIIRAVFMVLTLLVMGKFVSIYEKSKLLYLLFYIFLIVLIIKYIPSSNIITVYYAFYRYCFSILFFSIFWLFIYKNITGLEDNKSIWKLIGVSLCGYIIGTSSEIVFFASCALASLIIIWKSISLFLKNKVKDNVIIDSLQIKLNRNFYMPVIFFAIGVILFVSSTGYREVSADRGMTNIVVTYDLLKEFTSYFINNCFYEIKEFWIAFLILACSGIYLSIRNKDLRVPLFVFCFLFSLMAVMFSLVLCGKTHNHTDFYIIHPNILFLYKMLLLISFGIILSYVSQYIFKNNKYHSLIISCLAAILFFYLSLSLLHNMSFIRDINPSQDYLLKRNQENYILEKITRFYYLNNKTAIIPKEFYENLDIYNDTHYFDGIDNITNCVYERNQLTHANYYNIYKTIPDVSPYICVKDNAIDEFYNNGGYITKEELNKLDFNRLFDEQYVLKPATNNKDEKYTVSEIKELIKFDEN